MPIRQNCSNKKKYTKEGDERITGELVICDSEEAYGTKLAEALLLRKEVTVNVRICTSLEMLERLLEIGKVQVLLISEDVPYSKRKQLFSGKRIVLTRRHCCDLGTEEEELRKYQSIDIISAEILKAFQKESGHISYLKRKKGRVISVYSPIHRIGKTTFAIKLGKKLAEKENVLYLNLETYAGMGGYFRDENVQNLSHLLYYARQEKDDISVRITSMVQRMGKLDYIPPMQVWTDLRMVTVQEWAQLLEKLLDQSIYDTIVLDVGDIVENVFELLNFCDNVLVLRADDVYGDAKMKQYHHMLHILGYRELERRSQYVDTGIPVRQAVKCVVEELEKERGREQAYATGRTTS